MDTVIDEWPRGRDWSYGNQSGRTLHGSPLPPHSTAPYETFQVPSLPHKLLRTAGRSVCACGTGALGAMLTHVPLCSDSSALRPCALRASEVISGGQTGRRYRATISSGLCCGIGWGVAGVTHAHTGVTRACTGTPHARAMVLAAGLHVGFARVRLFSWTQQVYELDRRQHQASLP